MKTKVMLLIALIVSFVLIAGTAVAAGKGRGGGHSAETETFAAGKVSNPTEKDLIGKYEGTFSGESAKHKNVVITATISKGPDGKLSMSQAGDNNYFTFKVTISGSSIIASNNERTETFELYVNEDGSKTLKGDMQNEGAARIGKRRSVTGSGGTFTLNKK